MKPKPPLTDVRWWCRNSLFYLCQILFDDIVEEPHLQICEFLEDCGDPYTKQEAKEFGLRAKPVDKLLVGSRGILKSSILQARLVQLGLQNPNLRVLLVQNTINNAYPTMNLLRQFFDHPVLQEAFPDIIPAEHERGKKYQWSKEYIELKRSEDLPEPTYTAAGIGKNLVSRHYNVIVLDDVVTATKDGFTGEEMRPSPMDIQKAIGWHQVQSFGLLDRKPLHRGDESVLYNAQRIYLNNRWGTDDFVDYVERFEPSFEEMVVPIIWPEDHEDPKKRGKPAWPSGPYGTMEAIEELKNSQSDFIFNTQSLCNPTDPNEAVFRKEWLLFYENASMPKIVRSVAMMDPALSLDRSACFTSCVVVGQDDMGNWYVLDAIRGHYDTEGQMNLIFNTCEAWRDYNLDLFAVENVLFQEKILDCARMDPRFKQLNEWAIALVGEKPHKNEVKTQRIEALQPRFRSGRVFLRRDQKELIHELTRYRRNTPSTVDLVDALGYIPRLLFDPLERRVHEKKRQTTGGFVFSVDEIMKEFESADDPDGMFEDYEDSERISTWQ